MERQKMKWLIGVFAAVSLLGCSTYGKNFTQRDIDSVKRLSDGDVKLGDLRKVVYFNPQNGMLCKRWSYIEAAFGAPKINYIELCFDNNGYRISTDNRCKQLKDNPLDDHDFWWRYCGSYRTYTPDADVVR